MLVADRYPLFVRGLASVISSAPGLTLAGAAVDGVRAAALIRERRPRVAVLDLALPDRDGREIVRQLRGEAIRCATLLLGDDVSGEVILQSMTAGAIGLLDRTTTQPQLIAAITRAADGQATLPEHQSSQLASTLSQDPTVRRVGELTPRELEILTRVSRGDSAATIANALQLLLSTVKTHVQNVYAKLGAHDRGSAVATAIRRGFIQ